MTRERVIAALVGVAILALIAFAFWRENERRYAAFGITGCFAELPPADSRVGSQDCTGARRLCRDVPPLVDWRRICS
jgi:hypothetical protein